MTSNTPNNVFKATWTAPTFPAKKGGVYTGEYDMIGGLLVPRTPETVKEKVLTKKAKDFEAKALEDPEAMDKALRMAAEKMDLVEKTKNLIDTLPEPDADEVQPTIGRDEIVFLDEMFQLPEAEAPYLKCDPIPGAKVKSDGGSTGYYQIPRGATELNDLIEHKRMGFALGNIFKACYRLGEKEGNDLEYDINKIIFFAKERLLPYVKKHGRLP